MKTTETVTLPLFFFVSFHLVWRCFFQQRFAQKCNVGVCAVFINFQCFLRSNFSPCNFCLLVVQLLLRFCFFRKNFQYAVARCVGYFSTTFCAEMQCRCFFAVLISFQCFVCAVIFHRVIFVCSLCSCSCDFVFHGSFCVFVCKLSGRLSGKVPRQGSLLVSTVCLA